LRFKVDLPNYGVFDEKRVFTPGPLPGPVSISAACVSAFPFARTFGDRSRWNASRKPAAKSCWCRTVSPYRRNVMDERLNETVTAWKESGLPLVYLNQVGGQDELVSTAPPLRSIPTHRSRCSSRLSPKLSR
jgi:NAD+ synthase